MFRLEKLEINGFKSFADRTTLVFGEGITCVVGPNGCGKSNVAEAISWVLGEQSAKNLRGGKMEDVIFNGTRDRKPTGMAEVLLTMIAIEDIAARDDEDQDTEEQQFDQALSSADRASEAARTLVEQMSPAPEPEAEPSSAIVQNLPTVAQLAPPSGEPSPTAPAHSQPIKAEGSDQPTPVTTEAGEAEHVKHKKRRSFKPPKRRKIAVAAGERIVVGRRLYRTGDSEYLMNGRPCLLRDVQDLFAGTGLGGAHYAIIEQGRIGQILSSKPLDRRALIEEAAGITKFKSRKRATELKLESARQNLTRLNDIISEVERQVNSLKRQAQKARRYRRLRDEMRALLKIVFTADYYRLSEAIERIARELTEAERIQMELDARVAEREALHRSASTECRVAEDNLTGLREQYSAIELEADRARNKRAFEQQQIDGLNGRVQELDRDQQQLNSRLALIEEASQQRSATAGQLEAGLSAARMDLLARETSYQEQTARVRDAEAGLEELRHRVLKEVGDTERLRNLNATLDDSLRRIAQRQQSLEAESERAAERLAVAGGEQERLTAEVEHDTIRLGRLNESIAMRAAELADTRSQSAEVRARHEQISSEKAAAEHRLRSLEDLEAHRAYYSDAVQQVMSAEHAAMINALGTLADFVDVEPQYERLVESLFSRELQCVLVPTIDDALQGVEYLKSESLGRGAFLVVGLHGAEGEQDDRFSTPEQDAGDVQREAQAEEMPNQPLSHFDSELTPDSKRPVLFDSTEPISIEHQLRRIDAALPEFMLEPSRPETWPLLPEEPPSPPVRVSEPSFELEVLRAVDLLGLRPEIKAVVERAFPEKCAASVVPDIEAALQLSIENSARVYVTNDGEQVVNGRLIVTGAHSGKQETSLLGLKRELKDLRIRMEELASLEAAIASEYGAVTAKLTAIEAETAALDAQNRDQEKQAAARRSRLEGLTQELDRARQHVEVVRSDLEQSVAERTECESRKQQVTAEMQNAETSLEVVQASLGQSQLMLGEMRAEAERLAEALSSSRSLVATLTERLSAARSELRRLESEAEELRSRINRNRLELYDSHGRIEELKASLAESEGTAERFETDRQQLATEINAVSEALAAARACTDQLESEMTELRQSASAAHDRRGQIQVDRARTESEAEHLAKDCLSELGMPLEDVITSVELQTAAMSNAAEPPVLEETPEDAEPRIESGAAGQIDTGVDAKSGSDETPGEGQDAGQPVSAAPLSPALDIESSRSRLEELRAKIDDMGPVNMMALEELEESEERFQFLSTQRSDILDSIKMTEEALSEIKRRSRERFRHAFTHINENFQQMFVELFGGGRGEMILIDEDDVLESGIDLIAQPPGKRLQNVLLLSGGEKAMAAIALVLAIFQYRPSPFCILDEVDAPLDEMNVGRFSDKVIAMSRETQFLVITHNKRTMESARALYGVTMEEPGVSKLVSVKFE